MKKIITLLFCTAALTSAFAQSNNQDRDGRYNRDYTNNNPVYQSNPYRISERDVQIQRISAEYDYRIQQVNYDRQLNRREKKRAIKDLESRKAEQINCIVTQFNNNNAYNGGDRGRGYSQKNHRNGDDRYGR